MRLKFLVLLALSAALALLVSGPAGAATIVVNPGGSIQSAVNAAKPGDTIIVNAGTYPEMVRVKKNGLQILGQGRPHLVAPTSGLECGFCVAKKKGIIKNVKIDGFDVSGFGFGIEAFGALNATFSNNHLFENDEYGIAAFESSGTSIVGNEAENAGEAGIYVGDSPNANATITGNVVHDNAFFGIFARDAMNGEIANNEATNNCVGMIFLSDAPPPFKAGGFWVHHNTVHANNKACPGSDESPPLSGIGILLDGAVNMDIEFNQIFEHHPTGPTVADGGVLVLSSGLGSPSTNNVVRNNDILHNHLDLGWDGAGTNWLTPNNCHLSNPAGLCH